MFKDVLEFVSEPVVSTLDVSILVIGSLFFQFSPVLAIVFVLVAITASKYITRQYWEVDYGDYEESQGDYNGT